MNFFHIFVRQRSLLALPAFVAVSLFLFSVSGAVSAQELKLDPKKVTGPDACGECHKNTITAWKSSKHSTTFKKLPRSKDAKKIAKAMGLRRIKAASDCLSCHFTSGVPKKKVKPIAGITCESCHGAGADYIKTHSDYGGKGVTKENETPEHKKERYAKSIAAGLIRPSKLYEVANNCYGCHTVPNEKLVNVGGHAAALLDQAQEDVLGPDVLVVEALGLLTGEAHHLAGTISEPVKHIFSLVASRLLRQAASP